MWGTYSDSDAKLWNDGTTFEDGEGYIKFWAVRKQDDQDEVVDCQAFSIVCGLESYWASLSLHS